MVGLEAMLPEGGTVLFLGAHCDDVEIGCGGTMLRLREERPDLKLFWATFTGNDVRRRESLASAERFLGPGEAARVRFHGFRDGFLPYLGDEVKDAFESLKRDVTPDLVFTHHRLDRHQDHRLVSELTWNTWRDHTIFEYEIPKYDGELGQPNCFVSLTPEQVERKLREGGFIKHGAHLDVQKLMDYLSPFSDPARHDEFSFSPEWLRKEFSRSNDPRNPDFAVALKLNMPAELLFTHRVWLGVVGVLSGLHATVPVRPELDAYLPGFAAAMNATEPQN